MSGDIFKSATCLAGDFAGVVECDAETSYFYLYYLNPSKISALMQLPIDRTEVKAEDIVIKWDKSDTFVGAFLSEVLIGYFDVTTGRSHRSNQSDDAAGLTPNLVWPS